MSEEIKKDDIAEKDVLKYLIDGFKNASKEAEHYNEVIKESARLNKAILSKGTKLGNAKAIKEVEQAVTAANSAFAQYIKNETFLNKLEATSIRAKLQLENAINAQTKATERATQKEAQLSSTYSIMDKRLKGLVSAYREIAIKKDLGWKITDKEATKYERLQKIITQYDSALKNTDATSGRYTRNVGNYASATSNLGNAFNQLTREAPAFANSMQNGFMAISNNLPIFFDAIQQVNRENEKLIAQGQPTKSVLKSIGSAVFSMGTALSAGVTLLTVFGAQIINAFTGEEYAVMIQDKLNKAIAKGNEILNNYTKALENRIAWDKISKQQAIQEIKLQIASLNNKKEDTKIEMARLKQRMGSISGLGKFFKLEDDALKASISGKKIQIAQQNEVIKGLYEYMNQLELQIYQEEKANKNKKEKIKIDKIDLSNKKEAIDLLEIENELLRIRLQLEQELANDELSREVERQIDVARKRGEVNISIIDNLIKNEEDYRKKAIQAEYDKSIAHAEFTQEYELAEEKRKQAILKLEKELADKRKGIVDDLNKAQEEFADEQYRLQVEADKKALEAEKKKQQQRRELLKLTLDYEIKQSEKRIELIDKEIAKANEQYNNLQELAKNGNISAQQSLAEQQKIINEANQKKIKEQKRIERLKLAETGYDIYSSKVEAGDKTPLLSTIKDLTLLNQFINSLPSFDVGTENTGKNGKGIDGKGGFQAILHPNERVMTSEQNSKVGPLTNNDLADLAYKYNTGQLINLHKVDHVGTSWDLIPLQKELQSIKNAIEQKPETNIGIGEITQSMMTIAHETKKGNKTIRKQYRIRRG